MSPFPAGVVEFEQFLGRGAAEPNGGPSSAYGDTMDFIRTETQGSTTVLTFDRPKANAIDLLFTEELRGVLDRLTAEPPKGGLVVTGAGAAFSGGVDFKAAPSYGADEKRRMVGNINRMVTGLYALPVPVIAAVNGHAIGGGLVLALACDVRLFADGPSKLGLTEVSAGIPYPACPMEVLKAELPQPALGRLVLTGEVFDPAEAAALGIGDAVVSPDALLDDAVARAQALAALPAYATVKEQLKRDTVARMHEIIATDDDPMLTNWV